MKLITLTAISGAEDMFDAYVTTQTETADEISKTFSIAGFNCVGIFNTEGVEATLEIGGGTQTISLIQDSIKDWWDYWFAPLRRGRDCIFYFPLQSSGDATLKIKYPGATAKCGLAITGYAMDLATTRPSLELGISDYSIVATNSLGENYFKPGNWAKRVRADLFLYNTSLDIAYREIVKNRGAACIFDYNEYEEEETTAENYYLYDADDKQLFDADGKELIDASPPILSAEYCYLYDADYEQLLDADGKELIDSSLSIVYEGRYTSESGYQSLIVYGITETFEPRYKYGVSNIVHESQGLI